MPRFHPLLSLDYSGVLLPCTKPPLSARMVYIERVSEMQTTEHSLDETLEVKRCLFGQQAENVDFDSALWSPFIPAALGRRGAGAGGGPREGSSCRLCGDNGGPELLQPAKHSSAFLV